MSEKLSIDKEILNELKEINKNQKIMIENLT